MSLRSPLVALLILVASGFAFLSPTPAHAQATIKVSSAMEAPGWAVLERQLLTDTIPAAKEYYAKFYDDRGYVQCFVRWGANDGGDDAFENFNRWPEFHAMGADDELLRLYMKANDGMIKQYTEAKTVETPAGRQGMYYKEYITQSDWMHHGEGNQIIHRMGLSVPNDPTYLARIKRFAGFYMGEDPEAPNYDTKLKLIRSMINGSRGPLLRKATSTDWVGDPFDLTGFVLVHNERNFKEFLDHYEEYSDVVGDHFLNLVATGLPTNAFMATGEAKYKQWMEEYMGAVLERMKQNKGIIPSFVDLDGKIGGPDGKWWLNAYGWGFSPVNPVNGRRENRNRIPRAVTGFANATIITGDMKYANAWRAMMDSINSNAREGPNGQKQYPSMYGAEGWYGWSAAPWNVGAMDLWYWTQKPEDRQRIGGAGWVGFLEGRNPGFPEQALQGDINSIGPKLQRMRAYNTPPEKRLADNMMNFNPVVSGSLMQLMWGALPTGIDGGLINARLRYFDPAGKRAGVPQDVGALVSELGDTKTVVTLVNLSKTESRTVIVQGGAYGEHKINSVTADAATPVNGSFFTVELAPGAGQKLTLDMKRYANAPTLKFPWDRK